MYVPPAFREDRPEILRAAMQAAGLAALVTVTADGPFASHLPLLLDPEDGPHGVLHGHIAKANPQWRATLPHVPALAIFAGPDAYISPSWYPSKQEHGRVVPTWNYVTVHAVGPVEFFDDEEHLHQLVSRLTRQREAARAQPWSVDDAPADFVAAQLRGIVGVTLRIDRLLGKWKLSQNRPAADQLGVVAGLDEANPVRAAMLRRQEG